MGFSNIVMARCCLASGSVGCRLAGEGSKRERSLERCGERTAFAALLEGAAWDGEGEELEKSPSKSELEEVRRHGSWEELGTCS